jgi:hypothetical protein
MLGAADADEMLQEIFLRLWLLADQFDPVEIRVTAGANVTLTFTNVRDSLSASAGESPMDHRGDKRGAAPDGNAIRGRSASSANQRG